MNCNQARAAYLAGDASAEHHTHLSSCTACVAAHEQLGATLGVLDSEALWQEPGPGLEDRIVALISGSAAAETPQSKRWRWAVAAAVVAIIATAGVLAARIGDDPDWEVALPGTDQAPAASGVVQGWNEDGGTRLRFDLAGLNPAPDGNIYEVWFSRGPLHISAGTFSSAGTVDMWTGISRKDYPRIWITLEPINTDESPSIRTVMDTG